MEMIYDLVTNGLAKLNLPLELNFLCIGLCQKILVLWFFMHYVHENVVVGIDLWWFPYIVQKNCDFSWFSKTLFSILLHVLWLKYSRSWKRTLRWSMKMLHVLRWKKSVYFRSWKRTLAWLQDWTRTLSLFNFPALDTLLPNGNTETTPTRCYLPWEEAGMRSPKISIRSAIFPGKILLCGQSEP